MHCSEAFLDIETTGLSRTCNEITVVGIYLVNEADCRCVQMVGDEITGDRLMASLNGVDIIYTYNGSRFDLPFIRSSLGIDLCAIFPHRDLMYDCWRNDLRGGLKSVERQLNIKRKLTEVDGFEAVRLWWRYVNDYDQQALDILKEYNREDVVNLKLLKELLI